MPAQNPIIDPGDGSGGNFSPYFQLNLSQLNDNLVWNASQEKPLPSNFILNLQYYLIQNPNIVFDIVFMQPVAPWLTLIGSSVFHNSITVAGGGIKNLTTQLSNIDSLPNGVYEAEIIFTATGLYNQQISTYDIASLFVTLTIFNNDSASIKVDKLQYNVFFNRSTNILNGETLVAILNNSTPIQLKFLADNFLTKTNITDSFSIENFGIENNQNLPAQGNVNVLGGLFKIDNSRIANVNINLAIGLNSDIFADKSSLTFNINKSTPQTANESVYITNPENKTFAITTPNWLSSTVFNGMSSSGFIKFTTVSSANIAGGIHTGNVIISYETKTITIPVVLTVVSFSSFQFSTKFCLDIPEIIFNRMNAAARLVRVTISAKYNLNGVETIKENIYAQPYVNEKALFKISDKIHSQFPRFKSDFFSIGNDFELMKNAIIDLKFEELDVNYSILMTETISNLKFFPGREPDGNPLISNWLFRKRNKKSVFFNSKIVGENIIVEKIESTNDVDELSFGSKVVKYYELPQNFNSIDIHFENDNLVPEWFTFTGEYKITAEFSHTYAKNIFKSQNEKYDFTKTKMLALNTGFFIKQELSLIEKMVESKLVFMKIAGKIYRCFSTTQKLMLDDSTEELLGRDLEFLIVEQ
ncbi:hypothetical protein [Chryseobacterium luquanense]|uniref:Uncharacterized protein n=1 Tax=Chryseobacterium luquanense TaxID=2983766 RepID=A0ABT3Y4N2_9FLAO|nr:hypothetical protein [Chryseobacterium luquanense]MCX8533115.1 hypothetical protein [Chryseobacterium luquanense]